MPEKVFTNICPAAGCHRNCALNLWVKDGKIRRLESATYPDDPGYERCICLRGLSSLRIGDHPDRLKYPVKRVGERGSGVFKSITWEEAFDTIAGKMLDVKAKYGPEAVKITTAGSSSNGIVLAGMYLGQRFGNCWGAGGQMEHLGWIDDGAIPAAAALTLGISEYDHTAADFVNSKMVILWGWNPCVTDYRDMKLILDAKDKGVKIVSISPIFNATAAKADWWIPIRAGTDGALALAMINLAISDGNHDKDFLTKYTVGTFLVREDNKLFLREDGKYLVWDEKTKSAKPQGSEGKAALTGSYTVKGVRCKPAFQLLVETAAQYTPEKTADITGVPAATIVKLAREYAAGHPSAIKAGYGMQRTYHGGLNFRAIITLAAVCGNIGVVGGGASMDGVMVTPIALNFDAVRMPAGAPGMKQVTGAPNAIRAWASIREGNPPVKVLLRGYRNPLSCSGHIDGWKDIYKQIDLIVVSEVFMTRTARWADIVLPEAMIFERDDLSLKRNYLVRLEKAVGPPYEAKTPIDIWSELARRVGIGQYFKYSAEDYIRMLLDTKHPSVAGITLERLNKEKIVKSNGVYPWIPFADKKFPTPSGKVEFYQEQLVKFGEELPIHKENLESPRTSPLAKKYPLTFFQVKSNLTTHSQMSNIDWLRNEYPEARLDINPADASERGIKDGDVVEVFNDRGKVKVKARLNEAMRPGLVNIHHGWAPEDFIEGHYNDLLHRTDDLSIISPSMEVETIVKSPGATAALIQYDCLVEVKKA